MSEKKREANLNFIPRSVITKGASKGLSTKQPKPSSSSNLAKEEENGSKSGTNDVKKFSFQQRWPDSSEPVCVVCGKYGEYICDATDEDVCSLECKQKNLKQVQTWESPTTSTVVPVLEESFDEFFEKRYPNNIGSKYDGEQLQFVRQELNIKVKGSVDPGLCMNFYDCGFDKRLLENLRKNDFIRPTAVQMQMIPVGLYGADALVAAPTTSGKTASFLLPILHKVQVCLGHLPPSHTFCKHPLALILSPTRELCMQIQDQFKALAQQIPNMKSALLIGGTPLPQQVYRLRHNIQVVIGTPGRINDILSKHEEVFRLEQIKMVVFDEVDVMLHMGFQNQIQETVTALPSKPQYMMFSATIPKAIEMLASRMMLNPIYISVGLSGVPNPSIKQIVLWVEDKSKKKKLFSIIDDRKHFLAPALVFVDSKIGADMLSDAINERYRVKCESLHSDKTQEERTSILENFRNGLYDILVSTNVMGRGIDLQNIRQVILFDMPTNLDDYVHQIGRAGNLHEIGYAICFINNSSKKIFLDLKELFEVSQTKLPDEIINSPYIALEKEKREKLAKKNKHKIKSFHAKDEDNIDCQSLIEILTKKKKRR